MSSDTTTLIRDLWSRLLAAPIGPDDDFFDSGGYSLLLIEMVIQAADSGLTIDPEQVFDHPTPAALAAALDSTPETVR